MSMPSIDRRTFLGTLSTGVALGLAGCSSSCPDSDSPQPDTVVDTGDVGSGFDRLPGGSWPTPRFDAGNTGHARPHRTPTDSPSLRWRTRLPTPDIEGLDAGTSPPTVADGRVYLTTGTGVVALSLRDGSTRWRNTDVGRPIGEGRELAAPVVGDAAVFAATTDGLLALAPDDGAVDWRYAVSATGPPALVDAGPVLPTGDGVVALTPEGSERWSAATGEVSEPPLAAAEGTVVAAGDGVTAVDAATGDRLWDSPVQSQSHPVVADGVVYLGTYEGLVALDLADGTERWTADRGSGRAFTAPVVTDETVYAVERPAEAGDATFAFDRTDDGPPEPRWCSYVGEGAVAAAADGHALALQSGGGLEGGPPARLVAFTRRFGEAMWGFANSERALPPAVLDGAVVVADRLGTVAAFGGG
ncbi:PQQ-binding-like beta-propeller repeat protein [Haloplanus salilacus]|uniref:outer membrane protein assembly factor BamB family protein n=1 Tax=Haloplanus salilacus TaxID=2949994 RepID=UPI0030D4F44E